MKNIIKSVIVLTLVVSSSILIIFYVWKTTYPYIIKQETARQNKAIESVLPGCTVGDQITVNLDDGGKFSYWTGTKNVDGIEKKYFAFTSVNYGYNVDIKAIAGVDEENRITGLIIFQQTETPGLAARLTGEAGSGNIWGAVHGRAFSGDEITEPWFQEQFRGIDLNKKILILNKSQNSQNQNAGNPDQNSINAVTGATATTKIITDGLKEDLIKLQKARLIHEKDPLIQQNMIPEQDKEGVK